MYSKGLVVNEDKQLKNVGLKITLPRIKILQILEEAGDRHLSAEDVYKSLIDIREEISLATIYRVLSQFETAGLITKHNFTGGYSVFEIKSNSHHDHLVCIKCGKIEEFVDKVIEQRQIDLAANVGYQITDHELNIYGVCPTCQK